MSDRLEFFESVVTRFQGCLYRCSCDEGYRMTEMTKGIEGITQYAAEVFTGPSGRSFASITHPDDIGRVDEVVGRAVENHSFWDIDYRLIRRDGSVVRIHENGAAVYDQSGRALYLEGAIIDSTQVWLERQNSEAWREGLEAIMGHTDLITRVLVGLKMLALNARIEAARAGTAGAGFSVVANEMKSMAADAEAIVNRIQNEKQAIDKKMAA
jgi:PAS domain S-box-containing protein